MYYGFSEISKVQWDWPLEDTENPNIGQTAWANFKGWAFLKEQTLYVKLIHYIFQTLSIWDWTVESETPVCTAMLDPSYGVQVLMVYNMIQE